MIFGPTSSGKSTLAGYASIQLDVNKREEFLRFKEKHKNEPNFEDMKYARFMDQSKTEIKRSDPSTVESPLKKKGSTMFTKVSRVRPEVDLSFNIIDTPGADTKARERIRGIFYGDIGIFVVECDDLACVDLFDKKNKYISQDFFTPLTIWSKFNKKSQNLIILLSKMDKNDFTQKNFDLAKSKIQAICQANNLLDVPVIPVSVITKAEFDHNITNKSKKLDWYNGPTLFELMHKISSKLHHKEVKKQLLISLEGKDFDIPGIGKVLSGKILSGEFKQNDQILITPIRYKGNIKTLSARVKSIKSEDGEIIPEAKEGEIIGIALSGITVEGKSCELNDCERLRTSLLIDDKSIFELGNTLQLRIFKPEQKTLKILQEIQVIWLGRLILAKIIRVEDMNDEKTIWITLLDREKNKDVPLIATIPKNKNNLYCFHNFIVKSDKDILKVNVEKIGYVKSIQFELRHEINTKNLKEFFNGFEFQNQNTNITFFDVSNPIDLIKQVKKFNYHNTTTDKPISENPIIEFG